MSKTSESHGNTATRQHIRQLTWFDAISEGEALTDGGTVETTYNEPDEPVDKKLFDDEGTLLFRVVYIRDENGRLWDFGKSWSPHGI